MQEFTPRQIATLERLIADEFSIVAFPLYANAVGIRKGSYAALLDPIAGGGFRLLGQPCLLLDGNLTVRITEKGQSWYVWKKQRVEATPERLTSLEKFASEVDAILRLDL